MNTNIKAITLAFAGLLPFGHHATAQAVKTISKGQKVNLHRSLVFGKHTIVEFYADW